jgi:hypothetical protein
MLNQQEPEEKRIIVYPNNLAQKYLGIKFKPAKETLNNYFK